MGRAPAPTDATLEGEMAVIDGTTWFEIMGSDDCWRSLAGEHVGRLAYLLHGEPEIVPLNFATDGHTVVFRTDSGTKLAALGRNDRIAFEVDGSDAIDHSGWSVLVKGVAERVVDAAEVRQLRRLPLQPWAIGPKEVWVRIIPESVTGRRIHRRVPPTPEQPG